MSRFPSRLSRGLGTGGVVVGVALAMVATAAVLGPARDAPEQPVPPPGRSAAVEVLGASTSQDLTATAEGLQARLRRLPADWSAWAGLGAVYVEQARTTADPTYYGRAEGAFGRSLDLRPDDNPAALTGLASLAAARHDFAEARRQAAAALTVNPYDATALGVLTDALVELGRYDEALATLQRMLDLKPGVPSLSRASYAYELRGDVDAARTALERALAMATRPADAAFALQHLGELAFSAGDLDGASARFEEGLRADPSYVPLLAGRARVLAARGKIDAALAAWEGVVAGRPQPAYLVEYGDLLASVGRAAEAERQYQLVEATQRLFRSQGANVDLELALLDADRGRGGAAVDAASAEWDRRRSVHVADAYAWALHAAGRSSEALAHARAAERLGGRNALFAYHRGMIEAALGMREQARASLTRALQINPYFSPLHAPVARRTLAELGGRP